MCQTWTGSGNKQISAIVDSKLTGCRTNNKEDVIEVGKNFNWHSICYVSSSCCRTLELEIQDEGNLVGTQVKHGETQRN